MVAEQGTYRSRIFYNVALIDVPETKISSPASPDQGVALHSSSHSPLRVAAKQIGGGACVLVAASKRLTRSCPTQPVGWPSPEH